MSFRGPYVIKPIPPTRYPAPDQTWVAVEPGPGQFPVPFQVFIGDEYEARRDDLPIKGPSFTIKPPTHPI